MSELPAVPQLQHDIVEVHARLAVAELLLGVVLGRSGLSASFVNDVGASILAEATPDRVSPEVWSTAVKASISRYSDLTGLAETVRTTDPA